MTDWALPEPHEEYHDNGRLSEKGTFGHCPLDLRSVSLAPAMPSAQYIDAGKMGVFVPRAGAYRVPRVSLAIVSESRSSRFSLSSHQSFRTRP